MTSIRSSTRSHRKHHFWNSRGWCHTLHAAVSDPYMHVSFYSHLFRWQCVKEFTPPSITITVCGHHSPLPYLYYILHFCLRAQCRRRGGTGPSAKSANLDSVPFFLAGGVVLMISLYLLETSSFSTQAHVMRPGAQELI